MILTPNSQEQQNKINEETEMDVGTISLDSEIELAHSIISMPKGIIGFEEVNQYSIELQEGEMVYKFENSSKDGSPIFFLINPYLINRSYTIALRDDEYETLGKPKFDDIIVLAILTLQEKVEDTTCNLLGPIVINNINGLALQVVNSSDNWGTKHLLSTGEKVIDVVLHES